MAASIGPLASLFLFLIGEKDKVLAGNAAVKAATELGMKLVPCVIVSDLSDTQKRGLILTHNRLAEIADWDDDILHEEIVSLREPDLSSIWRSLASRGPSWTPSSLVTRAGVKPATSCPRPPPCPCRGSATSGSWASTD